MKRRFDLIHHERGLILPYILLIILIAFICLTSSVYVYNHERSLTQHHINQLKIDTLIQMAYTQFRHDFPAFEQPQKDVYYTFPDGQVHMTYTILDDLRVNLYILVQTNDGAVFTTSKVIGYPT